MSERRIVLRYRAPDAVDGKVEEYWLGKEKPPYLVVLKDRACRSAMLRYVGIDSLAKDEVST